MNLTGQKPTQKPPPRIQDTNKAEGERHLVFVKAKPCLICGRRPVEAHHIRLGLRTMGKRVCHSKTVPLDFEHHKQLHQRFGDEADFWAFHGVVPAIVKAWVYHKAAQLWHERTGEWPAWWDG